MTEQPGDVLEEAAKLFEVLRSRMRSGGFSQTPRPAPDDVWGQATYEDPTPRIATGAPECRNCPICRAIAAARVSGPDVVAQVMDAGQSLYTALQETLAAFERSWSAGPERERATPTSAPARPKEEGPGAGGDPIDIG